MKRRPDLTIALLVAACGCPKEEAPKAAALPEAPSPARRARAVLAAPPSAPVAWIGEARPEATPEQIVTLAPGITEMAFALGRGDRVVATSRYADHPPEAKALPNVGGLDLDVEATLAHRPDLVVGIPSAAYLPRLEKIAAAGVPVLVLPGSSVADLLLSIETLGATLDARARAEALTREIRDGLLALAAQPAAESAPRVAFVYGWRPLYVAGPGSFPDELCALVGAVNAVDTGGAWDRWSYEGFLGTGAQVIIDATEGAPAAPRTLAALPAVRAGRVYAIPHPALRRPSPRIVEAARALARTVHSPSSP